MKYLLDTHVFIRYAVGDEKLSTNARSIIESYHERYISIASIWEMAIKISIGHLSFTKPFQEVVNHQFKINEYQLLPIEFEHLFKLSTLELHHRDPFDRLIISQAIVENISIVSADEVFDSYNIKRVW
jgi:PIN domain nuclease of toxin-antitoxin system